MLLKTLPNIETARLLLRGLRKGDDDFLAMLDTDPVVMRYNESGPMSQRQATDFARMQVEIADSIWKRTGKWLIELKGAPTRIGWVNVSGLSLEDLDSLSVSYEFASFFGGHGYAAEAIAALVDDCFERLDEPRLVALVRWDNERSVRVLRKLGFRPRGRRLLDGADHLCELYEINQREWKESRVLGPDPIRNENSTPYLTPEQYFELEHAAVIKSEQRKGLTRATTGETVNHSSIVVNIIGELRNCLRGCRVFNRDLQIHVPATGFYTYPDVSVVSGDVKLLDERKDVLLNPVLIVEVVSPDTRNYDSGYKFGEYRAIPGLCEYLMVDEARPFIQQYAVRDGLWTITDYKDLTETVELVSVPATLPVAGIYHGIKF